METALIILVIIAIAGNILMAIAFFKGKNGRNSNGDDARDAGGLKLILEQVNELSRTVDRKVGDLSKTVDSKVSDLTKTVDTKIHETSRTVQESMRTHLAESSKLVGVVKEITQGLTKLEETNKQVVSFADQLQNLQDILKNPKQRGILGEFYLETLLKNVMPPGSYAMQYELPAKNENGGKVIADAAVFVKDKIIPIDSKFSLENYNRLVEEKNPVERDRLEKLFKADLKTRIDETAKYIQPENGTMDFAFMFIPHEAIYYDLLVAEVGGAKINTRDLVEYAFKDKRVLIVSPTSFLAFLQTVLQGLKALQIEETAKDIVKRVNELGKHLKSFEEFYQKMGTHLGTVVNQYNLAGKEFKKIDKDVMRITGTSPELEAPLLEKPDIA
ncbi:DNA recombination protein RmuC [Patescibacteria group bacterium]|nr:DNA recombination protein RmuC [Patescibacteria group bacterium]MDE1946532.1 DNA recombination protein RmuC [Patescibacteria group bacterium]MDE2010907.1 DNA recombination protein RmuC [Patescibacteria group bacterium]MDE2232791.1 DNA recombination protein RmuC [Patescibacteria group bacterium]